MPACICGSNCMEFEVVALACVSEVFHEKAQKNEILKLEKLSRAEAKVPGLSKVRLAEPIPAGLM